MAIVSTKSLKELQKDYPGYHILPAVGGHIVYNDNEYQRYISSRSGAIKEVSEPDRQQGN